MKRKLSLIVVMLLSFSLFATNLAGLKIAVQAAEEEAKRQAEEAQRQAEEAARKQAEEEQRKAAEAEVQRQALRS